MKHNRNPLAQNGRGLAAPVIGGLLAMVCGLAMLVASGLLTTQRSTSAQPISTPVAAQASPRSLSYAVQGEDAVGYRTFKTTGAKGQPLTLRAWYPASRRQGEQPQTITYSAPNKFDEQITPSKTITSVGHVIKNARPEQSFQPFPLVVFSHGFSLSPIVYGKLVEHYASRGYVVLAPEHNEAFNGSLGGFWRELIDRPVDIHRTIDFAERLTMPGAALAGSIDLDNIAVVGHSYGGYTALATGGARFDFEAYKARCAALKDDDPRNFFCAPVRNESDMATRAGLKKPPSGLWPSFRDPRVKAVVSMAGDAYLFDRRGLAKLNVPVMALGGTVDAGTPYGWGTKPTYDYAGSKDKSLVTFPGAGHMIFLDPCKNLPWTQDSFYRDGFCVDAVWDKRPFNVVAHYTTAFLSETLNADSEARALLAGKQPKIDHVRFHTTIER